MTLFRDTNGDHQFIGNAALNWRFRSRVTCFKYLFSAALLCVIFLSNSSLAQTTQPKPSPGFQSLKPLTTPPVPLKILSSKYPQFKHVPFADAGVNPVVLPFHYRDTTNQGAPEEALAFSFLLSADLDWMPEIYVTRHAYFIYKRQAALAQELARSYAEPILISNFLMSWRATHGIGGEICRQSNGYTGTLMIFNPQGKLIYQDKFSKPQTINNLLADMDLSAMKIMGGKPSDALAAQLHLPRYTDPSSLKLLGKAAFAPERTKEEFDLYKDILEKDPDFVEVRYWYANQKWWLDQDTDTRETQFALALNSRITLQVLQAFSPWVCSDQNAVKSYPQWIEDAEKILGTDSPQIQTMRVNLAITKQVPKPELLAAATKIAGKYPNHGQLLGALAEAYSTAPGLFNLEMAQSLYLTQMQSRYLPGNTFDSTICSLAKNFLHLGKPREAFQILSGISKTTDSVLPLIVQAKFQSGNFQEITQWFQTQVVPHDIPMKRNIFHILETVACLQEDSKILKLLHKQADFHDIFNDVVTNCESQFNGDTKINPLPPQWYPQVPEVYDNFLVNLITISRDLRSGRYNAAPFVFDVLKNFPDERLYWVAADQYLQNNAAANIRNYDRTAWNFYTALEFMHGDDPWVQETVNRWRKLNLPKPQEVKVEENPLFNQTADTDPPVFTENGIPREAIIDKVEPFSAAARVVELIAKGKKPEALALARKYRQVSVPTLDPSLLHFSQSLVTRVEQKTPTP